MARQGRAEQGNEWQVWMEIMWAIWANGLLLPFLSTLSPSSLFFCLCLFWAIWVAKKKKKKKYVEEESQSDSEQISERASEQTPWS